MKVAIVLDYVFFRHDVKELVWESSKQLEAQGNELILLTRQSETEAVRALFPRLDVRAIDEKENSPKSNFINKFWQLFMKTPEAGNKFYHYMTLLRLLRLEDPKLKKKALRLFKWQNRLPNLLSYDWLLHRLPYKRKTNLEGIDRFLLFSDIFDNALAARLIREHNDKVYLYIYSWDHPCKFLRFPSPIKYLSWSKGLREDLAYFQRISKSQIQVMGSTQLTYMNRYKKEGASETPPYPFPYIYYAAAVTSPKVLAEERAIITRLNAHIKAHHPELRIVFRPYPVLDDWSIYEELKSLSHVVFDDQFDFKAKDADGYQLATEKYDKMSHALGFLHLGTTMGLEAAFTNTPSCILNFESFEAPGKEETYHFVNQYQNRKYIILEGYPNVLRSIEASCKAVDDWVAGENKPYLEYNKAVAAQFPLMPIEKVVDRMIEDMRVRAEA